MYFFLLNNICNGQTDTIFFNADWKSCLRKDAQYYRIVTSSDSLFLVRDVYISNHQTQMHAYFSSLNPEVYHGNSTYYNEDGSKSSEGNYDHGKRRGQWILWDDGGKDSSVVNYLPDGSRKWLKITSERKDKEDKLVYTYVEEMPHFHGGPEELQKYLRKNIKYPEKARQDKIEGTVVIQFIVDEDGAIIKIVAIRELGGGCTEEAIRVIKNMPKWVPGKQSGSNVNVYIRLPITFQF